MPLGKKPKRILNKTTNPAPSEASASVNQHYLATTGEHFGDALAQARHFAVATQRPVEVTYDGIEFIVDGQSNMLDILNRYCEQKGMSDAQYEDFFVDYYGSVSGDKAAHDFQQLVGERREILAHAMEKQKQRIHSSQYEGKIENSRTNGANKS